MSPEWIGLLSLAVLFGAIFIGFPIAFTLIAVARPDGFELCTHPHRITGGTLPAG